MDELTFEQWCVDVKVYQNDYPAVVLLPEVRKLIIGKAKSVVHSLGPQYTIDDAIEVLAKEYEGVASSDVIFKEFYEMHQEKNERVQVFSVWIREALDRLTVQFPGRVMLHEEDKTLCNQLFYGMKSELKNGVGHLYDRPKITFGELLNKARKVELEDNEVKGVTKVQTKSTIMGETSPMSKLQQQVAQLTTFVKSAQIGPKKINAYKGFPRKNDNQNNNGPQKDQNDGDTRMQFKGPETGPNGPFGPGQRPIQCYKCKGWGHPKHLCPSQLNFTWRWGVGAL